jgi:antitoxin PrlF
MSADLISPTGVDIGSSQVDVPCTQGFLALLETDIQKGRHQSSLSDGLMQAMLDKSMEYVDLLADIEGNVAL